MAISGGAAIVAPAEAFASGVPPNALILIPLTNPAPELQSKLATGAVALTPEQMWSLLGFHGPAVQVTDTTGQTITMGLDDVVLQLQKHWDEAPSDLARGRMLVQELLKHERFEQAEIVLTKLIAGKATGCTTAW